MKQWRCSPIDGVSEGVVAGEADDRPATYRQGEETLDHSRVPHFGREDFVPLRSDKVEDSFRRPWQRDPADEQRDQHHVREDGREVSSFARWSHSFDEDQADADPREEQTNGQTPFGCANTVVNAVQFLQHVFTTNDLKNIQQ